MCRFPEIDSIYLNMPNIHFLPVNMPTVGVKVNSMHPTVIWLALVKIFTTWRFCIWNLA
jgi:hypothetical protein